MKGKAKIQLINAKTNKIEKELIEENMITNAYKNIMNINFPNDIWTDITYRLHQNDVYTPLYQKLFGGILLFSKTKTADANNIMLTSDDFTNFIGNAGSNYAGKSVYRGTLNEFESHQIANGYRFVWDFPTGVALGDIASICLTSQAGGNSGLINDLNDDTNYDITSMLSSYARDNNYILSGYEGDMLFPPFYQSINEVKLISMLSNTSALTAQLYLNNSYKFSTLNIKDKLNLTDNIRLLTESYFKKDVSDYGGLTLTANQTVTANHRLQDPGYVSIDPANHLLYSITYDDMGGSIKIYKTVIDYTTFTIVSDTNVTISDCDIDDGIHPREGYYDFENNYCYILGIQKLYRINLATNTSDFLSYPIANTNKIPYVINKVSDFFVIMPKEVTSNSGYDIYIYNKNKLYPNRVYFKGSQERHEQICNIRSNNNIYNYPLLTLSTMMHPYQTSRIYNQTRLLLLNTYLSSVNNLSETITKYSDQVLKITYDITTTNT